MSEPDAARLARDILDALASRESIIGFPLMGGNITELARAVLAQHAEIERLKTGLREALELGFYMPVNHARIAELRKLIST